MRLVPLVVTPDMLYLHAASEWVELVDLRKTAVTVKNDISPMAVPPEDTCVARKIPGR